LVQGFEKEGERFARSSRAMESDGTSNLGAQKLGLPLVQSEEPLIICPAKSDVASYGGTILCGGIVVFDD
jgi:hypothetical protein